VKNNLIPVLGILVILVFTGCPTSNDPTPDTEKAITDLSFKATDNSALTSDVIGFISGTDITVTVPHGTDITALVTSFTIIGTGVAVGSTSQISGITSNNFTNTITYSVSAEDGSTQNYYVSVTIASLPAVEDSGFNTASNPGDSGILAFAGFSETITMIYANNQTNIDFPTGTNDADSATLTTKFFMSETEVTNFVIATILQWAYDNGKFSSIVSNHNGLDTTTAKHGGQQLLNLGDTNCRVDYNDSGIFSFENDYKDHPVTNITWYGSVMFCNWLTEMRDGNINNVVYVWIDNGDGDGIASDGIWQDDEIDEYISKTGYRLPSNDEWEYTARYLGTSAPSTGSNLDTERLYGNDNVNWTNGYYWTPGDYASGATADYNDATACQVVAVYDYTNPNPYNDESVVKSLGSESNNTLGLFDMSGNVSEWCFTEGGSHRTNHGSNWYESYTAILQIGQTTYVGPTSKMPNLGFRFCRTAD